MLKPLVWDRDLYWADTEKNIIGSVFTVSWKVQSNLTGYLFKTTLLSAGHYLWPLSLYKEIKTHPGTCFSLEYGHVLAWFTVLGQLSGLTRTSPIWTYGVSLGLETHRQWVTQCILSICTSDTRVKETTGMIWRSVWQVCTCWILSYQFGPVWSFSSDPSHHHGGSAHTTATYCWLFFCLSHLTLKISCFWNIKINTNKHSMNKTAAWLIFDVNVTWNFWSIVLLLCDWLFW